MRPMQIPAYNRCARRMEGGAPASPHVRGDRRGGRRRPRGRAPEPQPAGAVAPDPQPRGRAGRPALRPHRTAHPAHFRRRGPAPSQPAAARPTRLRWASAPARSRAGDTGVLRVGATPQVIENVLACFLPRYRNRHPGVEVHLVEEGGRPASRMPRSRRVPRGADDRGRPALPRPSAVPLGLPRRHGAAPPAEPPGHAGRHRARGRAGARSCAAGSGRGQAFDDACRIAHIAPALLLESAAPHSLIALARAGYGIAVIPSPVLPRPRRSSAGAAPGRSRSFRASAPSGAGWAWRGIRVGSRPPYAERFVEELAAYVRHAYPGRGFIPTRRRSPPAGARRPAG